MATGLPTLSQIHAWDVDHLVEAAEHWHSTADRWESVYGQVWQQSLGMDWHGQARDALIDRTTADRAMVSSKADQLRDAALSPATLRAISAQRNGRFSMKSMMLTRLVSLWARIFR